MNESGIHPKGYTLLIKLDKVDEGTGLIAFSPDKIKSDQLSQTKATIIEIGSECWNKEGEARAKVGDRIIFRLYAGEMKKGKDGEQYRIINDDNVYAVLDEDY